MKAKRLAIPVGLGLLLVSLTVFQALQASVPPSSGAPRLAPLERRIAAEGRVVGYPGAEVAVAAERGGRIVRVLVQENQVVQAGQLLAELEADELRAQLAEARARAREAEAELRLAQLQRGRRTRLAEEGVVARHDLDEAERDAEIASARLATAGAEIDRLLAQLRKSRILAPIAGTLVRRDVDAGETVAIGAPIATVANLGRLRVEAECDESDAAAVLVGAAVSIRAQGAAGESYPGKVEEVAESVTLRRLKPQDPARPTDTRILAVKIAFDGLSPLRLGTTVDLAISPREARTASAR